MGDIDPTDIASDGYKRERVEDSGDGSIPDGKRARFDVQKQREIDLMTTRTGGAYIPPAKLRAMQATLTDKTSEQYQRMSWETLKKGINGLVNKVNVSNIKDIVVQLFGENLVRGRGLLVKSVMKAQHASPMFTSVYTALIAVVNTKLPAVGALLLNRLIYSFLRSFRRNDKPHCLSATTFIAHLVNQQVAHEIVALQILALLLERPTDDSVEVAVGFMKEVGLYLSEESPKATHATFERFRSILHEADIDKRVQYMIEVLFQVRKDKFRDNPVLIDALDLVEDDEKLIHNIGLDDEIKPEERLDVFRYDADFQESEAHYDAIKKEILGGSDDDEEEEDGEDEVEEEEEGVDGREIGADITATTSQVNILDKTETNLVNLRKEIYLTIMSSLDFEEAVHKLLKKTLRPGQESHLCSMIVECCSQERMYEKYYGLIGERFCKINKIWTECFSQEFSKIYDTIHRYETNRIRNIGKFYGHLFSTDAISWSAFQAIRLSEEDTTSSSRIFVKILFQELSEILGVRGLSERFADERMAEYYRGLFPIDNPRDLRFSINYFTSIGMGPLTENMRVVLKEITESANDRRIRDAPSDDESSVVSSGTYSSGASLSHAAVGKNRGPADDTRRDRSLSPKNERSYRDRSGSRDFSRRTRESRSPPRYRERRQDSYSPPRYRSRRTRESRSPPRYRERRQDSYSPPRYRREREARSH